MSFDGKVLAAAWSELAMREGGFTCSEAAHSTQLVVGATMFGYWAVDNPTAELGQSEGGHDFLLVEDRYIVDFWAAAYCGKCPVLDLVTDIAIIRKLYGNPSNWEKHL